MISHIDFLKQICNNLLREGPVARLVENASRLDRMRDVLGNLELTNASATRSPGFPVTVAYNQSKQDRR